jgi:hypothetical protein
MPSAPVPRHRGTSQYRRCTISKALLTALSPEGAAAGLVDRYHGDSRRLDLHLRGYPDKRRTRATLYCGLTNALDVIEANGQFLLKAAGTWRRHDHRALAWEQPLTTARLAALWPDVDSYLDNVIPEIEKPLRIQAGVSNSLAITTGTDRVL